MKQGQYIQIALYRDDTDELVSRGKWPLWYKTLAVAKYCARHGLIAVVEEVRR